MRSLLAGLVFLASCGARPSTPPPPPTTTRAVTPPPNPSGPSEAACDALFSHALAIVLAERQPPATEADQTALRAELRTGFVADCRAGQRAYYECGLAAKSRADLDACKR